MLSISAALLCNNVLSISAALLCSAVPVDAPVGVKMGNTVSLLHNMLGADEGQRSCARMPHGTMARYIHSLQ